MKRRLNDSNPRREQRRQERLLIILERRFQRAIAAEIARASASMVRDFVATGAAPTLPDDHVARLTALYMELAKVSIEVFGGRIVDQGKSRGLALEVKDFSAFFERVAVDYIANEAIRARITNVSEATRSQIVNLIVAGQQEGLGVSVIAAGIAERVGSISKLRGALIARTETHGAANFGADQAARATGLTLQKEWVSTEDERTRTAHSQADGAVVDMDQSFNVGGEKLQFPGDPNGSAGNTINCRCAVSHIVID